MRPRVSMLAALLACAFGIAPLAATANRASPLVPTTAADAARIDPAATATPLYTVAPGLFDQSAPDLGLQPAAGAETFTVFAPTPDQDRFNNGAVLIAFKGRLYAQWQSSRQDEDSADTWVAMSHSDDGRQWSAPQALRAAGRDGVMHSNGGWWTDGETLVAYINVWPTGFQTKDGGWTEYMLSRDGRTWSAPQRVLDADGVPVEGVIEQDPHRLADGHIVTAFHLRPGMRVAPHVTADPLGISGWQRGAMVNHPHDEPRVSRELEPSVFLRRSGGRDCAVMVFRDQADSWRQLASESCDSGWTWTPPTLTAMPDSRAKQSAGNLPDGSVFLVNAPNADRVRIPLAVTLSADGHTFDRSVLLRGSADLPTLRHEGRYKRPGYHYPKSLVWNGHLHVAYAVNKEDIVVTRVPLSSLIASPAP